jgi:hypothetical protein
VVDPVLHAFQHKDPGVASGSCFSKSNYVAHSHAFELIVNTRTTKDWFRIISKTKEIICDQINGDNVNDLAKLDRAA